MLNLLRVTHVRSMVMALPLATAAGGFELNGA